MKHSGYPGKPTYRGRVVNRTATFKPVVEELTAKKAVEGPLEDTPAMTFVVGRGGPNMGVPAQATRIARREYFSRRFSARNPKDADRVVRALQALRSYERASPVAGKVGTPTALGS